MGEGPGTNPEGQLYIFVLNPNAYGILEKQDTNFSYQKS